MAKTKSGYVYLLKSESIEGVYKVGCTRLDPNQRAKKVNYEYKSKDGIDYRFSVLDSRNVKDPFSVESLLKNNLIYWGFCNLSELFELELCETDEPGLIDRFNKIIAKAENRKKRRRR